MQKKGEISKNSCFDVIELKWNIQTLQDFIIIMIIIISLSVIKCKNM